MVTSVDQRKRDATVMVTTVAPPKGESAVEVLLYDVLRDWWDVGRPGWVDPGWWSLPVRAGFSAFRPGQSY